MELSVLISVYAGENPQWLYNCLQSLVNQDGYLSIEVVLVKDGNLNPMLDDVIADFSRNYKSKVISLDVNLGLGAALNAGLVECSNPFVARIDADDLAFSSRLLAQFEYLQSHPMVDVVGSFALEIDSRGNEGIVRTMPVSHEQIYQNLWTCPLIHPSVMFRRDRILEVGNYNPNLRRRQDYELWFRCAKHGLRFANIPRPLLYYRFDRNTHKKQSSKLAWEQGKIGFVGSSSLKLAWWKRLACFIPFIRSFLPSGLQHVLYRLLKAFDPRHRY